MTTSPFLGRLRTMTLIERDSSTQARFTGLMLSSVNISR
jgi:hypothetical protein